MKRFWSIGWVVVLIAGIGSVLWGCRLAREPSPAFENLAADSLVRVDAVNMDHFAGAVRDLPLRDLLQQSSVRTLRGDTLQAVPDESSKRGLRLLGRLLLRSYARQFTAFRQYFGRRVLVYVHDLTEDGTPTEFGIAAGLADTYSIGHTGEKQFDRFLKRDLVGFLDREFDSRTVRVEGYRFHRFTTAPGEETVVTLGRLERSVFLYVGETPVADVVHRYRYGTPSKQFGDTPPASEPRLHFSVQSQFWNKLESTIRKTPSSGEPQKRLIGLSGLGPWTGRASISDQLVQLESTLDYRERSLDPLNRMMMHHHPGGLTVLPRMPASTILAFHQYVPELASRYQQFVETIRPAETSGSAGEEGGVFRVANWLLSRLPHAEVQSLLGNLSGELALGVILDSDAETKPLEGPLFEDLPTHVSVGFGVSLKEKHNFFEDLEAMATHSLMDPLVSWHPDRSVLSIDGTKRVVYVMEQDGTVWITIDPDFVKSVHGSHQQENRLVDRDRWQRLGNRFPNRLNQAMYARFAPVLVRALGAPGEDRTGRVREVRRSLKRLPGTLVGTRTNPTQSTVRARLHTSGDFLLLPKVLENSNTTKTDT